MYHGFTGSWPDETDSNNGLPSRNDSSQYGVPVGSIMAHAERLAAEDANGRPRLPPSRIPWPGSMGQRRWRALVKSSTCPPPPHQAPPPPRQAPPPPHHQAPPPPHHQAPSSSTSSKAADSTVAHGDAVSHLREAVARLANNRHVPERNRLQPLAWDADGRVAFSHQGVDGKIAILRQADAVPRSQTQGRGQFGRRTCADSRTCLLEHAFGTHLCRTVPAALPGSPLTRGSKALTRLQGLPLLQSPTAQLRLGAGKAHHEDPQRPSASAGLVSSTTLSLIRPPKSCTREMRNSFASAPSSAACPPVSFKLESGHCAADRGVDGTSVLGANTAPSWRAGQLTRSTTGRSTWMDEYGGAESSVGAAHTAAFACPLLVPENVGYLGSPTPSDPAEDG